VGVLPLCICPGVLPLVCLMSDPHQRCGTALYCSCPGSLQVALLHHRCTTYSASAIDMGRCPWQHRISYRLLPLLLATASAHCSSCWMHATSQRL
jgi:hypothetical protein